MPLVSEASMGLRAQQCELGLCSTERLQNRLLLQREDSRAKLLQLEMILQVITAVVTRAAKISLRP